jgi:hypothetical protein
MTTPNDQFPTPNEDLGGKFLGNWKLGIGSSLEIGNWELGIGNCSLFPQMLPHQPALQRDQLADAGIGEIEQTVEGFATEGQCFGRSL